MSKTKKFITKGLVATMLLTSAISTQVLAAPPQKADVIALCGNRCILPVGYHYNTCPSCGSSSYEVISINSCTNKGNAFTGYSDVDYQYRKCSNKACNKKYKGPQYVHKWVRYFWED